MKVLFDDQTFTNQIYGGISRYFFELMTNYRKLSLAEWDLCVLFSNNFYLQNSDLVKVKSFFPNKNFKGKGKIQNFFNQRLIAGKMNSGDFDVFHPTYYNPYFLKYLKGKPFVLTVHDMIHEKLPDKIFPGDKSAETKKILIHKADKIIAISNNTKKDILEIYPDVPESKITVIYHANSLKPGTRTEKAAKSSLKIPERYLLVVGNRFYYKNCLFMIESIAKMLSEDETLFLICAGGGGRIEYEKNLFESLGILDKVLYYPADDETLITLYSNALAFILPSLYEGFGIPVLEAMDCGCPAILSNTSSLPEVGGSVAQYFDPLDKDSIMKAVSDVVYDKDLRARMKSEGYDRGGLFTWEKTATETAEVYRSVL